MKEIAVITRDSRLARKLKLALSHSARVEQLPTETVAKEAYDAVLIDLRKKRSLARFSDDTELSFLINREDEESEYAPRDGYIPIVWREDAREGDLPYPFYYRELDILLSNGKSAARLALLGERTVRIDGEKIKLSTIEYKLLTALVDGGDSYVPRRTLVDKVWGNEQDEGILNVYVHYLREKLERGEERLILSSRKAGYKINENYLGGRNA
jgi:hypothetical protein